MWLTDLFRPKWRHPDPKIRARAVASLNDDEKLTAITLNDQDAAVSAAARNRIVERAIQSGESEQRLRVLALGSRSPAVRVLAVNQLADPAVLEQVWHAAVVLLDDGRAVAHRLIALGELRRLVSLPPERPSSLLDRTVVAAEKLENFVKEIDDPEVLEALCLLPDTGLRGSGTTTRLEPVPGVIHPQQRTFHWSVDPIRTALGKLGDPLQLARIVRESENPLARLQAVPRVSDAATLVTVLDDPDPEVRRAALTQFHRIARDAYEGERGDRSPQELALRGSRIEVRVYAAACADATETQLAQIVLQSADPKVARLACARLSNLDLLAELHRSAANEETRRLVRSAMSPLVTAELAQSTDASIRLVALSKVREQQNLAAFVLWDPDPTVRARALELVTNVDLLGQLSTRAPDEALRAAAAASRLRELRMIRR